MQAGRCLDVRSGGVANGALLQIYDCNIYAASNNQYFAPQAM